ncbi:hypothetical protein A2304_00035 [Candidatus Uhrbacteria bacterium RIFOXYB2_FULL_57_15]|uniref:Uncharacterized protein n=1 Tax=Candidatus Uhrbacteria bacterium RIFOXYB2_FULL_57_15 TaxID=1802422 RepID=A0A1F7W967_9BACT|nr:MAG: hypothetical protein A2304_00035 [Candidatus Uhrbacteria bacterium RIFOXYB2_FULL_57_15]
MHSHDNPPKNKVRDAWMDFLPASFEIDRAPVGLYLPGAENLELDHYARKGIAPRQLIGCERDVAILPEVVRNARGIRVIAGAPAAAAPILMRERIAPIRFANLDFEGGYETHVRDILAALRLTAPCCDDSSDLAVTSYAARGHSLRDGSLHASKFRSTLDDHEMVYTQLRMMERRYEIAATMLANPYARPYSHLRRELGFMWWMVMGLGLMDIGRHGYGAFDTKFLSARISPGIDAIELRLNGNGHGEGLRLVREPMLAMAMEERTTILWPTAFRHILYYSPSGQPMQAWFLKYWRIEGGRYSLRDLCRQVWDLAVRTPLTFISADGMDVTINN